MRKLANPLFYLGFLALTFPIFGVGSAIADEFDDQVQSAHAHDLADPSEVHTLFWSQEVKCDTASDNLMLRQCQGLRDLRRSRIASSQYLVDVGSEAITSELDATGTAVVVTLRSCVSCTSDSKAIVVGQGVHTVLGNSVNAAVVVSSTRKFPDTKAASQWSTKVASRLRAQLLVELPSELETFPIGARQAYKVKVLAHRLYDPCQGEVLEASPASVRGPVVPSTCGKAEAPKVVKRVKTTARLNTSQIKGALKGMKSLAKECHSAYGIEGRAMFKIVIAGSGKLASAKQSGDFKGTPTGLCLDRALETVKFPKSQKAETTVSYPIMLR